MKYILERKAWTVIFTILGLALILLPEGVFNPSNSIITGGVLLVGAVILYNLPK